MIVSEVPNSKATPVRLLCKLRLGTGTRSWRMRQKISWKTNGSSLPDFASFLCTPQTHQVVSEELTMVATMLQAVIL